MEKKLTKIEKLKMIADIFADNDFAGISAETQEMLAGFIAHEIELAEKKKSAGSKNALVDEFTSLVLDCLTEEPIRASELLANETLLAYAEEHNIPLRIQRITSALKKLTTGEDAPAERVEVKKNAYFKLKV